MRKLGYRTGYGVAGFLLALLLLCPHVTSALAVTIVPVSSHTDIVNAIDSHTGQTFTMEIQSSVTLGGTPAIVIPAGTNVTLTNKAGVAVVVDRDTANSLQSRIDIQGGLTIIQNSVGGGSLTFASNATFCAENPQFAVSGADSWLTVESGTFTDHNSGYGVIYSADDATTTINGGTFQNNHTTFNPFNHGTGQGGVIWAANCNLIINGGTFTGNTTDLIGGVIYYEGRTRGNKLQVAGGTFTNNTANGAFGGGAIFIDCVDTAGMYSLAEITGGVFDGNAAPTGAGGALYIQKNAEVKIANSSIWNNRSTGDGGGIWNCATGGGGYYSYHGMYLSDNTAAAPGKGDDFYSVPKQVNTEVYLTDYAFTGARFNWTYDDGVHTPGTLAPSDYYQESNAEIAVASGLPSGEEPTAKVFFRNNRGLTGGAIANNGVLQMGEASLLAVQKQTTVPTGNVFHFQLRLLNRNGLPMSGSFLYRNSATTTAGRITFDASGIGSFDLAAGQQITLLDLPVGTHYTATEISLPDGWKLISPNGLTGDILSGPRAAPVHSLLFVNEAAGSPAPHTGDDHPVGLALALLALSLIGIIVLLLTGRRSRRHHA